MSYDDSKQRTLVIQMDNLRCWSRNICWFCIM